MNIVSSILSKFRHIGVRAGIKIRAFTTDRANRRTQQNELLRLTPRECVRLYQQWREGKYADPQIVFDELEEYDETLGTVVDNRQSALGEMDWDVLILAKAVGNDEKLTALAEAQQQYVTAALQRVENLDEAILHLGMSRFRGFSHLEVHRTAEGEKWLPIPQWFLHRVERGGAWYYNENADSSPANVELIDMNCVISLESPRPIDIVAMFMICAKSNAITNWDGFLERFADPALILKTPPNTTDEKMQEYAEMLRQFVGAGTGVVPAGSEFETIETRQTSNEYFSGRADWCDKAIVRRATGGMLTVLAESGTGTLAGNAHQETFKKLASSDARAVAAAITRQYVKRLVKAKFPGCPCLVYFSIAAPESADVNADVDNIVKLSGAGYHAGEEEVSERVGMKVTYTAPAAPAPSGLMMNAADTLPKHRSEPAEPPLTEEELAAFAACKKPDKARMNQRRAEVERAMRRAADIPQGDLGELLDSLEDEEPCGIIVNSRGDCEARNKNRCPYHGAGKLHGQVGQKFKKGDARGALGELTPDRDSDGKDKGHDRGRKPDDFRKVVSTLVSRLEAGDTTLKTPVGEFEVAQSTILHIGKAGDPENKREEPEYQFELRLRRMVDELRTARNPHEIWEQGDKYVLLRAFNSHDEDDPQFKTENNTRVYKVVLPKYRDRKDSVRPFITTYPVNPENIDESRHGKLIYKRDGSNT